MFERNAHYYDASKPMIANEMRSISEEANRYLTEDGAFNELKQVSLIRGSKEFKALSDSIKELRSFARRNGNFLGDVSRCEEFKELLSLVSLHLYQEEIRSYNN